MRVLPVVATVCTAGAAGITGLAVVHAVSAADALEQARAGLVAVQDTGTSAEQARERLDQAASHLREAEQALDRWPVDVLAAVPVLGRSWEAERAVTSAAREVVTGATVLVEQLPTVQAGAGGVDLASITEVRAALETPVLRAQEALSQLRDTPVTGTPPQVRDGVSEALAGLEPAVEALTAAHSGLGVLPGLLGGSGPRSVLVMLQNNAELRGAGGYAATFATGRLEDGRFTLDPLQDVAAAADPPARAQRVPAPPEYAEDFSALSGDTTIWRSWNMSPHVPDAALVAARVAGVLLPEEPDLVVLLDVPAMGALAGLGGGPITLPDGSAVSPDGLAQALLVDTYASAGEDTQAQLDRRAALQGAATAAVTRLLEGEVPASAAARTLARLASERHLAVWSARPQEQAVLEELGAAGAVLPPAAGDLSHVSVNNIGYNKLDQYVDRDVSIDVVLDEATASVTQRVRFTNEAPADLVPYVAGFDRPGVVVSRVEFSLPPSAQGLAATVDGRPWSGHLHDGPTRDRLSTVVELPRGASTVLDVRYSLPVRDDRYALRVVPQPLVSDADLRLSVRPAEGTQLGEVIGAERTSAGAVVDDALDRTLDVTVEVVSPTQSRWERLRQWWESPLRLP